MSEIVQEIVAPGNDANSHWPFFQKLIIDLIDSPSVNKSTPNLDFQFHKHRRPRVTNFETSYGNIYFAQYFSFLLFDISSFLYSPSDSEFKNLISYI